jgi:hypothetical protein
MNPALPLHRTARRLHGIPMPTPILPEGDHIDQQTGNTITIPAPPVATQPPATQTFTAADIEAARKQEKDKVYGRIEEWESKFTEQSKALAALQEAKAKEIAEAAAQAAKEAEEAARKRWEEEDSKTLLKGLETSFEQKIAALEAAQANERAAFAKESEFRALSDYVRTKVDAALNAGEIAPELAEIVTGNTQQEIDASLEFVKAKSAEIVNNIKAAQGQARAAMPGVSTAGYATTGPMNNDAGSRTFTAAEIQAMPMAEYAQYRAQLIPAASQARQGQGMYA